MLVILVGILQQFHQQFVGFTQADAFVVVASHIQQFVKHIVVVVIVVVIQTGVGVVGSVAGLRTALPSSGQQRDSTVVRLVSIVSVVTVQQLFQDEITVTAFITITITTTTTTTRLLLEGEFIDRIQSGC